MIVKILGQGLEATSEDSVGNHLIKFLADTNFHSLHVITAFTSLAAINGLRKHIENAKHLKSITIVTGVDQEGTSKEALEALMNLEKKSYIFFVPPPSPIFHPKIYLFEGKNISQLIIGSSNLTARGLFTNVEASLLVSIDNKNATDRKKVEELKQYFAGLYNRNDGNLKFITQGLIDKLVKAKIVPTEAERKKVQDQVEKKSNSDNQNFLSTIFEKRKPARIPKEFTATKKVEGSEDKKTRSTKSIETSELLWESGPLKERDLNILKGSNTNPTGSMLFKKGRTERIDQKHYFREEIFADYRRKLKLVA
ncbi:MAG TPA: phospholipase D family protein [Segetibacter sp.]